MPMPKKGDRFGQLTFVKRTDNRRKPSGNIRPMALFRCDCGLEKEFTLSAVTTGRTKQCYPCGMKITAKKRTKHKKLKHPLYAKWQNMKARCYRKSSSRYKSYGAKGVRVCEEWKSDFVAFYEWCIANGWEKGLELERVDVEGNYKPDNCKFIPKHKQAWNKRTTFRVEVDGEEVSLVEFMNRNGKPELHRIVAQGIRKYGLTLQYYIDKYDLKTDLM